MCRLCDAKLIGVCGGCRFEASGVRARIVGYKTITRTDPAEDIDAICA